jgi:hypothetical protein
MRAGGRTDRERYITMLIVLYRHFAKGPQKNCNFSFCFCMGVKFGLSQWRKNLSWGPSNVGYWGRYCACAGRCNRRLQKIASWGASLLLFPIKYYSCYQDKENRLGGTYGACSVVWRGNLKEIDDFVDLHTEGNIILKLAVNVIFLNVGRASGI